MIVYIIQIGIDALIFLPLVEVKKKKHKVQIPKQKQEANGQCKLSLLNQKSSGMKMGVGFSKVLTKKPEHEIPINASPDYTPQLTYKQPRKNLLIAPPLPLPPPKPTECCSQTEPVLGKPYVKIKQMYEMKEELGRGKFGVTYLCVEKATGRAYACKSIAKKKPPQEMEDVRMEVVILQHLSEQHNIVEFKGAYEDRKNVHLVMELCSGGELFDRIVAKGNYTERQAAKIMK